MTLKYVKWIKGAAVKNGLKTLCVNKALRFRMFHCTVTETERVNGPLDPVCLTMRTFPVVHLFVADMCVDPRPAVRKSSGQTLFSTIAAHGVLLQHPTWQTVIWQVCADSDSLIYLIKYFRFSLSNLTSSGSLQPHNRTPENVNHLFLKKYYNVFPFQQTT